MQAGSGAMCTASLSAASVAGESYGLLMRKKPRIVLEKLKVDWKLISLFSSRAKRNFAKPHRLQNRREHRFATGAKVSSKRKRVKSSDSLLVSFPLTDSLRAFLSRERCATATEEEGRETVGGDSPLTQGFEFDQPASCSQAITTGSEQKSTCQFHSQMNTASALRESERRKELLLRIKLPGKHTNCNPSSRNVTRKSCVREPTTRGRKGSAGAGELIQNRGSVDASEPIWNHQLVKVEPIQSHQLVKAEPIRNHQLVKAVGNKVFEQSQDGEGKGDTVPLPEVEVIVVDTTDDPDVPNDEPLLQPVDSVTELSTPQQNELLDTKESGSQTIDRVRIEPGKKAGVLRRRCYRMQVGLAKSSSEDEQTEVRRRRRKRKLSGEGPLEEGSTRKTKGVVSQESDSTTSVICVSVEGKRRRLEKEEESENKDVLSSAELQVEKRQLKAEKGIKIKRRRRRKATGEMATVGLTSKEGRLGKQPDGVQTAPVETRRLLLLDSSSDEGVAELMPTFKQDHVVGKSSSEKTLEIKRRRGRPKLKKLPHKDGDDPDGSEVAQKHTKSVDKKSKPCGRLGKNPHDKIKRPRGRPRKTTPDGIKQPRGRPRKKPLLVLDQPNQNQLQGEDSGYPHSISSSETSSRMQSSISPVVDSLYSVIPPGEPIHDLHQDAFKEQRNMLPIQKLSLQSLDLCNSILEQQQDLAQVDHPEDQVHPCSAGETLSSDIDLLSPLDVPIPNLTAPDSQNGSSRINNSEMMVQIFPELDALFDPSGQLFEPGQMVIAKVESLSSNQEIVVYDDIVDSILGSETISQSLEALPQLQMMGEESSVLVPDQKSGMESTTVVPNFAPDHIMDIEATELLSSANLPNVTNLDTQILEEMTLLDLDEAGVLGTVKANLWDVSHPDSSHCHTESCVGPKLSQTTAQSAQKSSPKDANAISCQPGNKVYERRSAEVEDWPDIGPGCKRRRIIRAGKVAQANSTSSEKPTTDVSRKDGDSGKPAGTVSSVNGAPQSQPISPGTCVPQSSSPSTSVPQFASPATGVPQSFLPGTSVPQSSLPGTGVPQFASPETTMRSKRGRQLKPTWKKKVENNMESKDLGSVGKPRNSKDGTASSETLGGREPEDNNHHSGANLSSPSETNPIRRPSGSKKDVTCISEQPFAGVNEIETGSQAVELSSHSQGKCSGKADCEQRVMLQQADTLERQNLSQSLNCNKSTTEAAAKNGGQLKNSSEKNSVSTEELTPVSKSRSPSASNVLSMSLDVILKEMGSTTTGCLGNDSSMAAAEVARSKPIQHLNEKKSTSSIKISRKSNCSFAKSSLKSTVLSQEKEPKKIAPSCGERSTNPSPADDSGTPVDSKLSLAPLDNLESKTDVQLTNKEIDNKNLPCLSKTPSLSPSPPKPCSKGIKDSDPPSHVKQTSTTKKAADEDCEDFLDIHPDDEDFFTVYSMGGDAKAGRKRTLPPQMPSPPREGSPDLPPPPMPYKKQQVIRWVEQQRRLTNPKLSPIKLCEPFSHPSSSKNQNQHAAVSGNHRNPGNQGNPGIQGNTGIQCNTSVPGNHANPGHCHNHPDIQCHLSSTGVFSATQDHMQPPPSMSPLPQPQTESATFWHIGGKSSSGNKNPQSIGLNLGTTVNPFMGCGGHLPKEQFHRPMFRDPPPPPPPPPFLPSSVTLPPISPHSSHNPFFATSSFAEHSTTTFPRPPSHLLDNSFNGDTGVGNGNVRYCHLYLRGHCPFSHCRYIHTSRDRVPQCVLEEALFRQPLALDKMPRDVIGWYTADAFSNSLIQGMFSTFVDFIKALMNKDFASTARLYQIHASSGVKFSAGFLSRLLEFCSEQTPHSSLPSTLHVPTLAEDIFASVQEFHGHTTVGNYAALMRTLAHFEMYTRMIEVYQLMKQSRVAPTFEILHLVSRGTRHMDHRVLQMLQDIKQCGVSVIEEARFVNRLLDMVDFQLLERHSDSVGAWMESSAGIADKLGFEQFEKLYRVFSTSKQWTHLLTLLDHNLKYIQGIGERLGEPLMNIINQLSLSEKTMNIVDQMTAEQLAALNMEVWNAILVWCAENGQSDRVSKFYHKLGDRRKQLSSQVPAAIVEMYVSQGNPASAMMVIREFLRRPSPLSSFPTTSVLAGLCNMLEKARAPQDLQLIVEGMIEHRRVPSPAILQSLLDLHSKEKIHSKIASIVKLARDCGVLLDRGFYQKALIELRHWGQDPDAVTAVYKGLRKVDTREQPEERERGEGGERGRGGWEGEERQSGSVCTSTTTDQQESFHHSEATPYQPSRPPSVRTFGSTGNTSAASTTDYLSSSQRQRSAMPPPSSCPSHVSHCVEAAAASATSMSLEGALLVRDRSSLLQLIEENGRQGQFGAVAAILANMQTSGANYDSRTIYAVWKAINNSKQKPPNAFESLITYLGSSHSNLLNKPSETVLDPNDRWLVSQIGIALIKSCAEAKQWQSGFVILHHLHRFGIHYVSFSQPSSGLPPLIPHPSPCSVALTAVKICLMVDQIPGALEVFKGCKWVRASNLEEVQQRTQLLIDLAQKSLEYKMFQEAWKFLEAIDSCSILKSFVTVVTNLHNKLLQSVLVLKQTDFALSIFQTMKALKLQCLPSIFSMLLQNLCNKSQSDVARRLCKGAIAENYYSPLVQGDLFEVALPPGLVEVEVHLLLEDHLRRIVKNLDGREMRPLVVHFRAGSRHILEHVCTKDFTPSLRVVSNRNSSVTITSASLQQWCAQHCSSTVPPESSNQMRGLKLKRPTRVTVSSMGDGGSGGSHGNSEGGAGEPVTKLPRLSAPETSDEGSQSSMDMERLFSPGFSPVQKCDGKNKKKQFRETVCRLFVAQLKPYYQAGKFKSNEDYMHLLRVLSTRYFKMKKITGEKGWEVTNAMKQTVIDQVSQLMARCSVYCKESDSELGLMCAAD